MHYDSILSLLLSAEFQKMWGRERGLYLDTVLDFNSRVHVEQQNESNMWTRALMTKEYFTRK